MAAEDNRYAVDIRVFVSVIVIAMAVSFGVGVGLGPTAHSPVLSTPQLQEQLPPVTSVEMNAAESALAAKAAADDGELHEPAGQVRHVLPWARTAIQCNAMQRMSVSSLARFHSIPLPLE